MKLHDRGEIEILTSKGKRLIVYMNEVVRAYPINSGLWKFDFAGGGTVRGKIMSAV